MPCDVCEVPIQLPPAPNPIPPVLVISMVKGDGQNTIHKHALVDQLNSLKREDEMLYNILAVDIWALAKTMDEYQPGFWSAFMKNREQALKRFIEEVVKSKPTDVKRPPFLR